MHDAVMLNVATDLENNASPQSQQISTRASVMSLVKKVILALSVLCSEADMTPVYGQEVIAESESSLVETEPKTKLQEWLLSEEARQIKGTLHTSVTALDNTEYNERQKAAAQIITAIDQLETIIFPFPEDLRPILGNNLFPSEKYDEDNRNMLREQYGLSFEAGHRCDQIQDVIRSRKFTATSRIIAGEYTPEELIKALEVQTGLKIKMMQMNPEAPCIIKPNENTWISGIEALRANIGNGTIHYFPSDNTIYIDTSDEQYRTTTFSGPYIFIQDSSMSFPRTFVEKLPVTGELVKGLEFLSPEKESISLESENSDDLSGIICALNSTCIAKKSDSPTRILTVLAGSAKKSKTIPFGQNIRLGRYQICNASKHLELTGWRVEIRIFMQAGLCYTYPNNTQYDLRYHVVSLNTYGARDVSGNSIQTFSGSHSLFVDNLSGVRVFTTEEPDCITVNYSEDTQINIVVLPDSSLPKKQNP